MSRGACLPNGGAPCGSGTSLRRQNNLSNDSPTITASLAVGATLVVPLFAAPVSCQKGGDHKGRPYRPTIQLMS